ncbi:MAG: hypothetical protein QG597_2296 [Actinomycetota bacterium]|nr:hypothetical protein [Actinomycetota bacterium]
MSEPASHRHRARRGRHPASPPSQSPDTAARGSADPTGVTPTPPVAWPAPDPSGDSVPGDPLVPINVWHLPQPPSGSAVSAAIIRRLIINYTRPGAQVIDLTTRPLPPPTHRPAAVINSEWPRRDTSPTLDPGDRLAACAERLDLNGCLAVVVPARTTPAVLGPLVAAGHAAGLRYLQHIVITHHLPRLTGPPVDTHPGTGPLTPSPHPRVHSDLLIFRRTETTHA